MTDVCLIDQVMLERLSAEAAASSRLRKNLNFHDSDTDSCHRLLNAMEPGTYIQPHCHLGVGKDETVAVLRGRLGLLVFDPAGGVRRRIVLSPSAKVSGVHIPRGVIHTWVVLEKGSVFLEAKAGPYSPAGPEERAAWAPAEGSPEAAAYLEKLIALFSEPESNSTEP